MQQVTQAVFDAVSGTTPLKITTFVRIGGEPVSVPVVSVVYTSAVGGDGGWSIGNAFPAAVQVALSGRVPVMRGAPVAVEWYVDEYPDDVYPLFSGVCDTSETVAGVTTVTAYDPLYSVGGHSYAPSPALLVSCTAEDVLSELAGLLGVQLDDSTASRAALVQLDTGISNLGDVSIAQAAGAVAGIMGGNACISRDGTLTIKAWQDTEWTGVTMAGTGTPAQEPFRPTGLSLIRRVSETVIGEDGTETTVERLEDNRAGDPNVSFSNDLATSVLAADAWAQLSTLPAFHAGGYLLAGGVLLEAGDVFTAVTEDGEWTVYAGQVTLSIDGGCNAQVECWGASEAVETLSPTAKAVQGVTADLASFKRLYADNLTAQRAYIKSLSADEAFVNAIFAHDINAQTLSLHSEQTYKLGTEKEYFQTVQTNYIDLLGDPPGLYISSSRVNPDPIKSEFRMLPHRILVGTPVFAVSGMVDVSDTISEGGVALGDKYLSISGNAASASKIKFTNENEINFIGDTNQHRVWFGYRSGDTDAAGATAFTTYLFGNKQGGTDGVTLRADNFTGTAAKASVLVDSGNSARTTTVAYSKPGLNYDGFTWLAAWNGYELRAINKDYFATAYHTHDYLPRSGGTITGNMVVNGWLACENAKTATSGSANVLIDSGGIFRKASSSSRRYKTAVEDLPLDTVRGLYSLPVHTYVYRADYIPEDDERYGKRIPGFIAEELEDILPIAVDHDEHGRPEMWNSNIIIPCMMRLVQDLNERVSDLKSELSGVKEELFQLKQRILEKE